MLAPLYLAEISPPEVRGSLMALEQFSIVLGVVLGFWTGFLTRNCKPSLLFLGGYNSIDPIVVGSSSWRIPLGLQLFPGIVLAIGCYFLPPSPRLLVLHGKYLEAQESLARLRLTSADDPLLQVCLETFTIHELTFEQVELLEMRVEVALIEQTLEISNPSDLRSWKTLFEEKYRERTLIGVLIMFFQRTLIPFFICFFTWKHLEWSGINALLYYGPTLVQRMGMKNDVVSLIVSGGIGIVQLVAVLPAILWIDKVGRRPLLRGA